MSLTESNVARHYGRLGLYDRIITGLAELGKSEDNLTPDDLKAVDEFHIGGVEATRDLMAQVDIGPQSRALDIGSGIGGTARHMAHSHGAIVTGLDLTPEYVETARRLTKLVGLSPEFVVGSALDMPFDDQTFDLATLIHVGMNLPDKAKLFSEVARVLKPGGSFAVYDVMQVGKAHPEFPVPWASSADTSFLDRPDAYLAAADKGGFTLVAQRERGAFARDFFARLSASLQDSSPPPVGLGLLMGEDAQLKIRNMVKSVGAGDIAPVEMIFRLPG
ncbi:class I SAM-dependent methyltransferase [Roseovarius sp.]|uniref:class I SAM-dependent methyltransferase n=1 Tax=Roseovarius sp. TaxID=1486281 RepID=UPI0025F67CA6|nr:class I SAM-dependent methyltransferase [Roseovarius sp.]